MAESQGRKAHMLHLHRFRMSLQQRGTDFQPPIFNLNFKAPRRVLTQMLHLGFPRHFFLSLLPLETKILAISRSPQFLSCLTLEIWETNSILLLPHLPPEPALPLSFLSPLLAQISPTIFFFLFPCKG